MAEILLTGARGQLGWAVHRLAGEREIDALDRNDLDVTNHDAVFRTLEARTPAVVINAAAYTAVDQAESDVDNAYAVNRTGPANLAKACTASGIALIHISTDYVFDGRKRGAYVETDPVAPCNVYGQSKSAGEDEVRSSCPRHIILRTGWVYGIHGDNFVRTMLRLGREQQNLRVVDDQHGCPTFASDLAEVVLTLAHRISSDTMPPEGFGTFHCAGRGQTTWCGLARKVFDIAGPFLPRVPIVEGITTAQYPTPARRPLNSTLDGGLIAQIHGIRMRVWEEALADMLVSMLAGGKGAHQGAGLG